MIVLVLSAALLGPAGAHAAGVPAAHADTAGPLSWSAPTNLEFASGGEPTAIACLPGDLCLVGDDTGEVLYSTDPFDGPREWTAVAADATAGAQHAITGLACPTASLCVAVDDAGGVLTTSDPTGPAGGWTRTPVDPASAFTALSCVSATSCVAVDQAGDAWRTQSPAGGASAWTSAPTGAGGQLSAVSCPTTTFCAAVDHAGEVLTDTAPSATWTVTKISSEPLNAVSCASATLCVAGGTDTGAIASSAPTGGAVAWHAGPVDPNWGQPESVGSVTCVEPTSCLIGVDEGLYETDDPIGSTWSDAEGQLGVSFDPIALSCVAGANCAGVDDEGNFGAGTSDGLNLVQFEGDAPDLNGVSCPTADRCFIDDETGDILTATHPTGGLTAWPAAPSPIPGGGEDGDGNEPYALACPSASLCLTGFGYAQRGDAGETGPELAGYSTAPTARRPWHQFTLPPHHGGFSGVTCTSSLAVRRRRRRRSAVRLDSPIAAVELASGDAQRPPRLGVLSAPGPLPGATDDLSDARLLRPAEEWRHDRGLDRPGLRAGPLEAAGDQRRSHADRDRVCLGPALLRGRRRRDGARVDPADGRLELVDGRPGRGQAQRDRLPDPRPVRRGRGRRDRRYRVAHQRLTARRRFPKPFSDVGWDSTDHLRAAGRRRRR